MKRLSFALCAVVLQTIATPVAAQDYPNRPIRVIVTTSPGGISDVFLRALEPVMNTPEQFRQFLIDDRVRAEKIVQAAGLSPQ